MTTKVYDVTVLLDLHKVNCPGVWLCPKGKVSIKVSLFGVSDFTKQVNPSFPLIFNERFHFQRKFRKPNTLSGLHKELGASLLSMTLHQFPTETNQSVKLAVFNSPLAHVLSEDYDISRHSNKLSDVDLLFFPCKVFPGIIAPKAEVVAKMTVSETFEPAKTKVNPTVSSFPSEKRLADDQKIIRQQPVCHTKNYFRCKCFRNWEHAEGICLANASKGRTQITRPRSARRTRRRGKDRRRFKSCSSAYYAGTSESCDSDSGEFDRVKDKKEDIANALEAHCRCACVGQKYAAQPDSSEYSSSDYTDNNAIREPLRSTGRQEARSGCQCFKTTLRGTFEKEVSKTKARSALKPEGVDDKIESYKAYDRRKEEDRHWPSSRREDRPKEEATTHAKTKDDHRRKELVLEKTTVDGRKWGVKGFQYSQQTSVR